MKFLLLLLFIPVFAEASPMMKHPWQWFSDPNIMAMDLERNFDKLPLRAGLQNSNRFWSGDYWALNRGNINYRWNSSRHEGFNYRSPSLEEARHMGQSQLASLSPTEKYDLFTGHYDYPLRAEVQKIANRHAESWEGICHGWAPASMNHSEPLAKTMMSADGIAVPFGSSDIKALISYYYANGFESPTHQMGWRCYSDEDEEGQCAEDLNAGAFHIVLTNKIAFRNEGIIVDLQRGEQVWNHPIVSFSSRIIKWKKPKSTSAPGTVRRPKMETLVRVILGTGNYWGPVRGTEQQKEVVKKYVYFLDLNRNNEIIGGDWKSDDRPDFLWVKYKPEAFTGTLDRLGELLNDN